MSVIFFCILLVILGINFGLIEGRINGIPREEELELERQLQILNKVPVRSFQNEDGSIFDCIEMNKQPAFDHPLLKNHTIQLQPSSIPKGLFTTEVRARGASKRTGVDCPMGTVPIRRTTKEDLLKAKALSTSFTMAQASPSGSHHLATSGTAASPPQGFYGVTAIISVYNVTVSENQSSGAGIWLQSLVNGQLDGIHYGWQVNPTAYGDHRVRTVAYWTASSGKTGCYNLLCSGFVQTSNKYPLGAELQASQPGGDNAHTMVVIIYKDSQTGNWVVVESVDGGHVQIGYWPSTLFTGLATSARAIQFGGEVVSPPGVPPPAMGSGRFEPPNLQRTSSISNIQFTDSTNRPYDPADVAITDVGDKCYQSKYLGDTQTGAGYASLFGGPGGPSCM
ncbi:hypothetical protein Tsubulata_025915 [Turnera subulata]|uniref:Neprosin PEP catalytic domain-containing protein n=1 Tax=Turnera subulata TaxID=218843 RepID=A0A9Q0FRB7_9ROSI|nr:hypothetical protein Tsubulata_025915 [Turnera subulata]